MVILVVYLFLNSFRAALIPAVVVPVSLTGTFGLMYLAGFTLDNFSLMAMTIATGFVVDDAIVVMENTNRHIENGMQPTQAALLGSREVGFTVVSMSLSLVAVFLPSSFWAHCRAAVQGVHVHAVSGHHVVAGRLVDHDTDDVRAPAGSRRPQKTQCLRARLQFRL